MKKRNMALASARSIIHSTKIKQFLIISSISRLFLVRGNNSLAAKLVQVPLSRIKETLDSEEKNHFSTLKSQDFSWDGLVSALLSSSFPRKANLVVEWRLEKFIKENEKNQDSYSWLILLCGKIHNIETASRIFSAMEAQGIKPTSSVFNALISACLASNEIVTALSLYELMEISEESKPDADTYTAFITAYASSGNKEAMQAWYSARMDAGYTPDPQTYDALIFGCVKSKDFSNAEKFYEEMTLTGFVPNLSILQNMLLVYSEQRKFHKIKEFMMFVFDGSGIIDRRTAKKVVALYLELGRVEDLEELLVVLSNSNQASDILSYVHHAIIRMYVRADRLDDVEFAVGRMLQHGMSFRFPDDVENVICLYFRQAAYERLDLFLECIRDSFTLRRSTYDLLVAGYRRAGLQEKLDMVIDEMKQNGFVMS
ncbi:pentatricopeptide repeat-containing protein At5g02860-like isoform X1 [Coffea eugenioides]|uniref:pentatricopeptide repeat-containing protein At5g02860-like isoform X1 n=1 Tax=Coffea eugenioides TaxID=49369 RepID=UPI000F607CAA|nr:pentatricopeptide repeat-containing protein At5g02860-like isoform X1 [Coffea eugenioides]